MSFRTGIHYSSQNQRNADPDPHVTVRVATSKMRQQGESIVLHARVTSQDDPIYIGSETYPDPTPDGNTQRKSYINPDHKAKYNQVQSSLFNDDDFESTPVGCVLSQGQVKWYVVDGLGKLEFLPEGSDGKFFSAGVGKDELLRFWDPLKNKTCRAVFYGVERPAASSPQHSTLDTNSSDLVEAFNEFNLQSSVQDKGAEISWGAPSMSSTALQSDLGSLAASNQGWSDWIWREEFDSYERSRKKPDGNWEYDYPLPSQPAPGSSPSASTSSKYTTHYYEPADSSGNVLAQANSSHPAALQSNVCSYVYVISRSDKYRCSLFNGREIQLRVDGWTQSTIDYGGSTVPCWAYTGKSGAVYYTWNFDMNGKGAAK